MNAAINATYVALSVTVLLLSWDNYKSALGQAQQQFQNYQNPISLILRYQNMRIQESTNCEQRPEFQLVSNEPVTISNKPAQKVVYTFEREEDGKTNKVMRIWSTNEDKLYRLKSKIETSLGIICNHCKNKIAEIFQESGEFCLHCWQERTYPNL
ncbi:MAG: hypothetical protein WAM27_04720 [Nitrososphaeraceae archaeon]